MGGALETELKFDATPEALAALKALVLEGRVGAVTARATQLDARYFDTPSWKLRSLGLSLRVRADAGAFTQTIKQLDAAPSALLRRAEWETLAPSAEPDIAAIRAGPYADAFTDRVVARLKPRFETHIARDIAVITGESGVVEAAFDVGAVTAGARTQAVAELELELKSGDLAALFAIARALSAQAPLQLSTRTKFERGYLLAAGRKAPAQRARAVTTAPDATAQQAFQTAARASLQQVVSNQSAILDGLSEGVHQGRVGLRRLRAAISVFRPLLGDPQSATIKEDLRWLGRELGHARDIDVFLTRVVGESAERPRRRKDLDALVRELRRLRRDAFRAAADSLRSDRGRAILLDVASWIETGDWIHPATDGGLAALRRPARELAVEALERRRQRILRGGRKLSALSEEERHRLRIQVKKLRYASEFFAGLYPEEAAARRRKESSSALSDLQDALGELQDIAVHDSLIEHLAAPRGVSAMRRREALKKLWAQRMQGDGQAAFAKAHLKRAEAAWETFSKVRPFWRTRA